MQFQTLHSIFTMLAIYRVSLVKPVLQNLNLDIKILASGSNSEISRFSTHKGQKEEKVASDPRIATSWD